MSIHNGIVLSQEKEGNPAIHDSMDRLEGIVLSEISTPHMWNLNRKSNL